MLALGIHYFDALVHWIDGQLPSWLQWLSWLLWFSFAIGFVLVFVFGFTFIANFIAAPFNGLLSEKVQEHLTGTPPYSAKMSVWDVVKDLPRILGRQLRLLGYYLPRVLLIGILFFIPIVQIIAGILWFVFSAWMMSLQYMDFPMDNNRIGFVEMRKQLKTKRISALGFGAVVVLLSSIPFINFFVMPAAVAGATKFWVDEFSR